MRDIVQRLRNRKFFFLNGAHWLMGTEPDQDCIEAAVEIERLRAVLKAIASCDSHVNGDVVHLARLALGTRTERPSNDTANSKD